MAVDKRAIRLMYEKDREDALRALEAAGISYREHITKGADFEKNRLHDMERDFRATMSDLGEAAVDTFHQMAIGTARELGAHGGIGVLGEQMAGALGGLLGAGATMGLGKALGVDTGPWKQIAAEAGKFIGVQLARSFERYESLRMLGAKKAAAMTGGVPTGGEDYLQMGSQYTIQSLEIRGITGASAQAVDELVTQLSRVGVKFDEAGKHAITYAMASDVLLNVEKGLTAELETNAVAKYGEAWGDVAEVIQDTTSVTQYWQAVAEQTGSAQASALASNQNVLNMYKQVMEATKGTSLSMTGMSAILAGAINTFGKAGLRPEMIGSLTAEMVGKMAPRTSSMEETIKQGFFLREMLNTTEAGRRVNAFSADITRNEQLDPLLSNIGLSMFLAKGKDATEQFGQAFLESLSASRDQIPGNREQKNTLMAFKMNAMTGMSPMASHLMIKLADTYKDKMGEGMTPSQALREAGRDHSVQAIAGDLGMRGVSGDEMVKRMAPLGAAAMSTETKLAMATERMAVIHEPKAFWANMGSSILDGIRKASETGAMMTGEGAPAGLKHVAALAAKAPAQPKGIQAPSEKRLRTTHKDRAQDERDMGERRSRRGHVVSSYTTSPGHGVRQVNMSVDDNYFADARKTVAAVAESYFPDDASAVSHMLALAQQESAFDPGAVGDSGLAEGLFQMHPELRKKYGVGKESSSKAQTKAASEEMRELLTKYNGNWDRAIEEYHLGNPAVRRGVHDPAYMSDYHRRYGEIDNAQRFRG
jgi:hypothetical protein